MHTSPVLLCGDRHILILVWMIWLSASFGMEAAAKRSLELRHYHAGNFGGSACESNTPSSVRTATGFEDREDHRTLSTSSA
jgi:hypothetical protein